MAKSTSKTKKKNNTRKIVIISSLLLLAVVAFFLYQYIQTQKQKNRFFAARDKKNNTIDVISTKTETLQTDSLDSCGNSRANKFEGDVLYCDTYAVTYIATSNINEARVLTEDVLQETAQRYPTALNNKAESLASKPTLYVDTNFSDKDLNCRAEIKYPAINGVGYGLPDRNYPDAMSVLIGCSGKARQSYFPFSSQLK